MKPMTFAELLLACLVLAAVYFALKPLQHALERWFQRNLKSSRRKGRGYGEDIIDVTPPDQDKEKK